MFDFIALPQNFYFSTALAVMLGLFVLQLLAFLLGGHSLDGLLPDSLHATPHLDLGHGLDHGGDGLSEGPSPMIATLSWLQVGRVPLLILLAVFLTGFGVAGLLLQWAAQSLMGHLLPTGLATLVALVPGVLTMRWVGLGLARILPKDETSAISETQFIGQVVTLVLGTATRETPAQGKFKDGHGTTHYVHVVPLETGTSFEAPAQVLLVAREGHVFQAVAVTTEGASAA